MTVVRQDEHDRRAVYDPLGLCDWRDLLRCGSDSLMERGQVLQRNRILGIAPENALTHDDGASAAE